MDLSQHGPGVNPLAAALANGPMIPSGDASRSGFPSIPGLPPGIMPPLPSMASPDPRIRPTGIASSPGAGPNLGVLPGGTLPGASPAPVVAPSTGAAQTGPITADQAMAWIAANRGAGPGPGAFTPLIAPNLTAAPMPGLSAAATSPSAATPGANAAGTPFGFGSLQSGA